MINDDSTICDIAELPSRLAGVLEGYLAELENGSAPDCESLLSEHPDLAEELRPYLDSLRMLHNAAREMKSTSNGLLSGAKGGGKPRQIGDYRIIREIGRGGMGIVYEAHQESLNRQVALKILPFAAVLDQRQIARFRTEAQAAAQLHHAHIVPVFAVGQEQGVYYYAMQYIEGQSLEQAIEELRLADQSRDDRTTHINGGRFGSTTTMALDGGQRLSTQHTSPTNFFHSVARLGIEAAEALQHAHEHGIIHRDVKPSNLLIDRQGRLWVTDFGLARMQADNGVTLTGDVVGTLRYMSPEQAGGEAIVDARTDVYSLGVTLYELLTRRHAHPGEDRQALLRHIAGEEPPAPRRVDSSIPVDLETIVLSAMSKSREERYSSASALADDLDRFLTGKPTLARRPTLTDRSVKWAKRHRSLVTLAASAVVVLCVVSVAALFVVLREQARTAAALSDAERSAQAAREGFARAERHFQQARGAVDQFGIRMADRLTAIPGAEAAQRDLLIAALQYYHEFVGEAGDDPRLRHEIALAHFKSGAIAAKLGATPDAIGEYRAAIDLFSQLTAADPGDEDVSSQLAVTCNNLGLLLASRGETSEARKQHNAAIDIQQRILREHPGDVSHIDHLAESQANLGMLLEQLGDNRGAERYLRSAVELLTSIQAPHSNTASSARNLAIVYNNLSYVLRDRDRAAAEQASRTAIGILERLTDDSAGQAKFQDDLALCYNNMAAFESQSQRWSEAIAWHRRAIELQEQMTRKSPSVVRYRSDLALSLNNLGVAYCRAKRPTDADAAFEQARALLNTLAEDYPDQLAYSSSLAALLNNQAMALAEVGRHEEALVLYPTAIEAQRSCWQRLPNAMREPLSKMYYNYGQSLRQTGQLGLAAYAATARRELWRDNGQRLFGVAVEMAEIARLERASDSAADNSGTAELDGEIIKTLRAACDSGWKDKNLLADDERFEFLQNHPDFERLLAGLDHGSSKNELSTDESGPAEISNKN
jgi:serine/threonine protein kinase/tetratricopeptide (TPR) repeat protein